MERMYEREVSKRETIDINFLIGIQFILIGTWSIVLKSTLCRLDAVADILPLTEGRRCADSGGSRASRVDECPDRLRDRAHSSVVRHRSCGAHRHEGDRLPGLCNVARHIQPRNTQVAPLRVNGARMLVRWNHREEPRHIRDGS
jgi:hypothetical protein